MLPLLEKLVLVKLSLLLLEGRLLLWVAAMPLLPVRGLLLRVAVLALLPIKIRLTPLAGTIALLIGRKIRKITVIPA